MAVYNELGNGLLPQHKLLVFNLRIKINLRRMENMQLNFEPIDLRRQAAYNQLLARCAQVASDYSFLNIWGWADEYGLQWAWSEDLVWIRQTRPREMLWAPVGHWQGPHWPSVLETVRRQCGTIIRVPQKLLQIWREHADQPFEIIEARDHWDYLYDRRQLIELRGNRYHKKKNLVNQFKRKYAFAYLPFGQDMIDDARAMQEKWCTWRDCESSSTLLAENEAITKVLDHWKLLEGITGGALRVDDRLVAYTIAETLPDDTLVIHFEKACLEAKGSYQAINQLFLTNYEGPGELVNREQDLGDAGLRKAKLSYLPVDYVRKYQVMV